MAQAGTRAVRQLPRIAELDRYMQQAITQGHCTAGACLLATIDGKNRLQLRHSAVYGTAAVPPPLLQLDQHALFDIGGLTQGLVTATLAMQWTGRNRLDLQRTLGEVLPDAKKGPLAHIPLYTLLDHTSGIGQAQAAIDAAIAQMPQPPRAPVRSAVEQTSEQRQIVVPPTLAAARSFPGPLPPAAQAALRASLLRIAPREAPGVRYEASTLHALLLGWAMESMGQAPLDVLFAEHVAQPLRLSPGIFDFARVGPHGPWRPPASRPGKSSVAHRAECPWRRRVLRGESEDLLTYLLGGVAGHAGVFASLEGILTIANALLVTSLGLKTPLHAGALARFFSRSKSLPQAPFALGWQVPCRDNGMLPGRWHPKSVGLSCPSGQSIFIDPGYGVIGIMLSNWGLGRKSFAASAQLAAFDQLRLRVFDTMASHAQLQIAAAPTAKNRR